MEQAPAVNAERTELQRRLNVLQSRLDEGLPKIQDALAQGRKVPKWEAAWIGLLHEYEQVYDRLEGLGG